jgi:manganese/zinc/iron transport system ATP- binding protein
MAGMAVAPKDQPTGAPLSVRGLTVAYGRRLALDRVSFEAPAACIVGVIGPNGAGKSTLLKALLGLVPVGAGELRTAGPPAYMPQSQGDRARLDLPLTALDVALMGRHRAVPWWRPLRRADRAAARAALRQVGAADLAGRGIDELSGGQRERVMLARALVQDAQVLLLDEPLAGVDTATQEAVLTALSGLRARGRTILVATHDLDLARRSFDRLLFLNRRLVAYGPVRETFTPETLRDTYEGGLVVVETADGRAVEVLDEASHH